MSSAVNTMTNNNVYKNNVHNNPLWLFKIRLKNALILLNSIQYTSTIPQAISLIYLFFKTFIVFKGVCNCSLIDKTKINPIYPPNIQLGLYESCYRSLVLLISLSCRQSLCYRGRDMDMWQYSRSIGTEKTHHTSPYNLFW